jgi:hypothetical protein
MSPESSDPSFRTMWWTTLSVLRQTSVLPWLIDEGLGENDWEPRSPRMLMPLAPAGGAGVPLPPAGLPLEPPQDDEAASAATIDPARNECRMSCLFAMTPE